MTYSQIIIIDGDPVPASIINDVSAELAILSAASNAAWATYTPVWTSTGTSPVLGNGVLAGRYVIPQPRLVVAEIRWIAGSTTTFGTGDWRFSLPFTSSASETDFGIGAAWLFDAGVNDRSGTSRLISTTTLVVTTPTGTVTPTVPWTWANGDQIRINLSYEPT